MSGGAGPARPAHPDDPAITRDALLDGRISLCQPRQGYRSAVPWTSKSPCLRLHIGLENPKDLIEDLEAGFDRLKSAAEG